MNGGTGVAALEDDQYNEHHRDTIVFSSFRVPQGGIVTDTDFPSDTDFPPESLLDHSGLTAMRG